MTTHKIPFNENHTVHLTKRLIINDSIIEYSPRVPLMDKISYLLEIERRRQIEIIKNVFKIAILDFIKSKSIDFNEYKSLEKSILRKLSDNFNLWLFSIYGYNYNNIDSVIPSIPDEYEYDEIYLSLKYHKPNITKIETLPFMNRIKVQCDKSLLEIKNSYVELTKKKDFTIKTTKSYKEVGNDKISKTFISIYIDDVYFCSMLEKIFNKLKNQYILTKIGNPSKVEYYTACCIYRHKTLGINNQSAAMPDYEKKEYVEKYDIKVELFASAFNNYCSIYCSLFYDIEKYFGSIGSYFDTNVIKGSFFINPPYIDEVMAPAMKKTIHFLENAKKNNRELRFVSILPAWRLKENGFEYKFYNIIINNKKFIEKHTLKLKDDYKFYVYFQDEYYNLVDVDIFILSFVPSTTSS